MRSEKKEITSPRGRGRRRATTDAGGPTPARKRAGGRSTEGVVSEERKTEHGEGGEQESLGVSRVCFDGVFAELQHFKEENGSLTISISHPSFLSILDLLSAVGMGELLTKRFHAQIDSLKKFSKEEERKDDSIADRASKDEEKPSGVSLTLDEKIRMKTEAKKVKSRSRRKRATTSSSLKKLPDKESVAAELQKKNARGTAHRSAAAVHRSLILKEMFCPSDIIMATSDDNEGSKSTDGSSPDDDSLGSLKTFHITPTADDIGSESWSNLDATLSSGKIPPAKLPRENRRNSAGKYEKTIRKKMGKEHRSSSMPASSTNDAAKDADEGGKPTDGTLKKKPHRRCTFEDRLRRKANGESLEDIYEDWQSGEEARPIRHDSFALDDVVGPSSDWRSKMNACGWQSKDDIGLESWSNLDATLSSGKELPPAKAPQENRRNSASKYEKTIRKKMGKEHRSSSMPTSSTNYATKDDNVGSKSTDGTLKKKPHRRCTFEDRLRRKANGESLEDIYEDWQSGEEARPIRHDPFGSNLDATLSSGKIPPAKLPQENRRNSASKYEKTIRKKMGKEHRSSSMPASSTNDATKDGNEGGKSTDGTLKKKPHRRCTFEDRLRRKANGESLEDIYEDWQSGEEARPIRHDSFALDDVVGSSSDDDSLGSLDAFQNAPMVAGWRSKMNSCGWQSKDDIGLESWSNLDATLAYSMKLSLGNHLTS